MIDPTINPSYRGVTPALSTGKMAGKEGQQPCQGAGQANPISIRLEVGEAIYTEQEPALE